MVSTAIFMVFNHPAEYFFNNRQPQV